MSEDYWESAYTNGEYKHWEFKYSSPELTALVAASAITKNASVLDVGFRRRIRYNLSGTMRI